MKIGWVDIANTDTREGRPKGRHPAFPPLPPPCHPPKEWNLPAFHFFLTGEVLGR